ncbi:MAG: beta-lactamase family protein, partial [Vicinamibacterales bacterium]|nr:beta-lactamase family protein [Vicinamibacterales bacterium]
MRLRLVLLAVLLLIPASGLKSAARFDGVRPRMQEFVDKGEISGVVTLIATPAGVIHLSAVGKADLATDRKMRTDDIFWIASMSKPITAVCIGILVDEGKLHLDDAVE